MCQTWEFSLVLGRGAVRSFSEYFYYVLDICHEKRVEIEFVKLAKRIFCHRLEGSTWMEFSPVFMRILTRKFAIKLLINMLFTNFEEYIYTEFTTTISRYNLRFSYSCTIFELASTNRLSLGNSILSDVNEFHCFWLKRCLISCTFIFLQLINQF